MSPHAITLFLAQTPAAAAAAPAVSPAGGSMISMLFFPLMLVGMYFFLIAPQRKKQKAQEKMLKALKTGDDVITTGGIFGTITNVKDDRFVLRVSDATKIEIAKGFIQSVVVRGEPEDKK